ncbi:MAG: hypothetical protein ACK4UU_05515 [Fimbriimonadales bacterium]
MRRCGLMLWALWLALTPIGLAWAQVCSCAGQLHLLCCRERLTVQATCCTAAVESACCAAPATPCSDCSGCQLAQAKPMPAVAATRVALDWVDWVFDAPRLAELGISAPTRACFGLPAVRNHSPPLEPSAPRAPPLC